MTSLTVPKILKKIIDSATLIELTLLILMLRPWLKLAEKFDHPFSHFFIFRNIFAQGHGFEAVTVAIPYFIFLH